MHVYALLAACVLAIAVAHEFTPARECNSRLISEFKRGNLRLRIKDVIGFLPRKFIFSIITSWDFMDDLRENVFVTDEFFEKAGISENVITEANNNINCNVNVNINE